MSSPLPPERSARGPSTRQLGMLVLFASLTMLFGATLVAYAVTRAATPVWRTAEMPELPAGLVGSTGMLAGVSAALERAVRAARGNRALALDSALRVAALFALAFLAGQALNWRWFVVHGELSRTLYPFTFFLLTGVHAAHVVGGLVPLGISIQRARERAYTSSSHEGVALLAQYWHFLGLVWLVILLALVLGS